MALEPRSSWKQRTLLVGAVIGAATGLGVSYLLIKRAEAAEEQVSISAGEGVRLGLLVLGLLRQVSELSD